MRKIVCITLLLLVPSIARAQNITAWATSDNLPTLENCSEVDPSYGPVGFGYTTDKMARKWLVSMTQFPNYKAACAALSPTHDWVLVTKSQAGEVSVQQQLTESICQNIANNLSLFPQPWNEPPVPLNAAQQEAAKDQPKPESFLAQTREVQTDEGTIIDATCYH